jgi:hypothetical protein
MKAERTTPEEITTQEAVIQIDAEAGARPRQTYVLHASQERYKPSNEGLSHLLRVRKENDPKAKPIAKSIHNQRS